MLPAREVQCGELSGGSTRTAKNNQKSSPWHELCSLGRWGVIGLRAMADDPFHDRLLAIVRKLPEVEEAWPWGSIHCKVAGKIFVGWCRDDTGVMRIGVRTTPELQSLLVKSDPRFSIAKYTGKYGGIDIRLGPKPNWAEVEQFIVESYRLIAPKSLVSRLGERSSSASKKRVSSKAQKRRTSKKKVRASR
jgi:predicted DNA-binding protein (MmcQ/YjbR family)